MELETYLKKSKLFEGLPENQLEALADITIEKYFDKGQPLFFVGNDHRGRDRCAYNRTVGSEGCTGSQ
jgi:hypothetical protein